MPLQFAAHLQLLDVEMDRNVVADEMRPVAEAR